MWITAGTGKNPIGGVAVIIVEYPVNWDITVTGEGQELTNTYRTGLTAFWVDAVGTYTVVATNGTISKTKTVEIEYPGEGKMAVFKVDMNIDVNSTNFQLFNAGTHTYAGYGNGNVRITLNRNAGEGTPGTTWYAGAYTKNKYNLDGYSAVRVHVSSYSVQNSFVNTHFGCGLSNAPAPDISSTDGFVEFTGVGWYEIELDNPGEKYIQFGGSSAISGAGTYVNSEIVIDGIEVIV